MNRKKIENKSVIITGASSGIGESLAREYAALGAKVTLAARQEEKLKDITSQIIASGGEATYCRCDVVNVDDCMKLIDTAIDAYGGVDILICNAGLSMRALFDDVDLEVLHKLMDVNFWGCVNCVKFALPHIQKSQGSIVGVSSVAGIHGLPARTGYSASKFAMTGFLETIRIENLKKGVHVMITCPGFTASNVRFSALTADGSSQGETPREEDKMMTSQEVAQIIIRDTAKRKRLSLMEFDGYGSHFVKKFFPAWLDKMFYSHMAKEPDSPLK
ncbi:MAG: SDR family oxidoreductase [Rikenellaceae bacterium]